MSEKVRVCIELPKGLYEGIVNNPDNICNGVIYDAIRDGDIIPNALQHVESVGEKTDCVEVVRCKDCRNRQDIGMGAHRWCDVVSGSTREDDFCSYGERKEE